MEAVAEGEERSACGVDVGGVVVVLSMEDEVGVEKERARKKTPPIDRPPSLFLLPARKERAPLFSLLLFSLLDSSDSAL